MNVRRYHSIWFKSLTCILIKSIADVIVLDFSLLAISKCIFRHPATLCGGHFISMPLISQDRPQIPNYPILLVKLQQLICKSSTLEMIENFMKHCADQTISKVLSWGVIP